MLLRRASKKLIFMSLTLQPPPFSLLPSRPSPLRLSLSSLPSPRARRHTPSANRPRLVLTFRASQGFHSQVGVREDYAEASSSPSFGEPMNPTVAHPWPEWTKLLESLRAGGYFDREVRPVADDSVDSDSDTFEVIEALPEEFVRAANACLVFARDRTDLLRFLSKKDIEVVVENGSAFLFKNGTNSTRRLRSFLSNNGGNEWIFEKAQTVDVMRFLLSYASSSVVASNLGNINSRELVEASVRNLLGELIGLSGSVKESSFNESMPRQLSNGYGQSPRPFGQNIEMKRGDWICPKCDFFNYGKNTVCLRCDCKCPGDPTFGSPSTSPVFGFGANSNTGQALNGSDYHSKSDIESRLAANEEKAQRWFNKISQMDSTAEMSSAIADEDFPEIMPLRKGVNRFVVSTRKTPLERRLANAQYRRNLVNDGSAEGNDFQAGDVDQSESSQNSDTSISQRLDRILGHKSTEKLDNASLTGTEPKSTLPPPPPPPPPPAYSHNQGNDSGYQFVPLPPDMFAKPQKSGLEETANTTSSAPKAAESTVPTSEKAESLSQIDKEKEQAEKSERWFKKVAELHDVTDLASVISDEDFPEIMPMRKGENRFVVTKRKDRSLTSPQYKRRVAMDQANNSNFVPFVPFPPGYFAKKDNKNTEDQESTEKSPSEASSVSLTPDQKPNVTEKSGSSNWGVGRISDLSRENQQMERNNQNAGFSLNSSNANTVDALRGSAEREMSSPYSNPQANSQQSWNSGQATQQPQSMENKSSGAEGWNRSFTGKSLEGSLVAPEPDPLDMSEEAKTERWFRRVAQIKDISELSQIPDEDFPSIMPMRKGVNRFVVSKRKTPLERRLTSPQYRRNLPIVNTNPVVKKDDNVDKESAS
ncbi:hypothetical protein ACLOJK_025036 [Asimina triloba]